LESIWERVEGYAIRNFKISSRDNRNTGFRQSHSGGLGELLKAKIAEYREVVESLSKKYNMDFERFKELLGTQLELTWEHEKDYLEWEEAVTNLQIFEAALNELKELRRHGRID